MTMDWRPVPTAATHRSAALTTAIAVASVAFLAAAGPPSVEEYRLKAEFIERFSRFVKWPAGLEPSSQPLSATPLDRRVDGENADSAPLGLSRRGSGEPPLVIGVIGRDPFGSSLEDLARRRTEEGRSIEVHRVSIDRDGDRSPVGCHLLFIAASEADHLDDILATTAGLPILTIGDSEGFGRRGVLINFFVDQGKIHFEINQAAVRRSGLELSSKLLKLGRAVGPEG